MSKAKRLKKRNRKRHSISLHSTDRHHLLWERKLWDRGALRELRNYHYCIIEIPKNTLHKYIHANMNMIPTPSESSARYVLRELAKLEQEGRIHCDDSIRERLTTLIGLFSAIEPLTANALRKQLRLVYDFKKAP